MTKKKERSLLNTVRALKIIQQAGGSIRPKAMAHALWPDSPRWEYRRKCGQKGVHAGMGMYCSAGCYLGTLARKGLLSKVDGSYVLIEAGVKFIADAEKTLAEKVSETVISVDKEAGVKIVKDEKTGDVFPSKDFTLKEEGGKLFLENDLNSKEKIPVPLNPEEPKK
jgi:hypothetical protein